MTNEQKDKYTCTKKNINKKRIEPKEENKPIIGEDSQSRNNQSLNALVPLPSIFIHEGPICRATRCGPRFGQFPKPRVSKSAYRPPLSGMVYGGDSLMDGTDVRELRYISV